MANVEVSRAITATNMVRNAYPDAVSEVTTETVNATWTAENNEIQLAFKMGTFPAAYAYKALVGAYLKLTASSPSTFFNYGRTWSLGDYTAASLTWNTRPIVDQTSELKSLLKSSGSVKTFSIGGTADSLNAYRLAKAAGILFTTNPYSANDVAFYYTQAAGTAAYRPSVVFIVDDSITVSSQVTQQNSPTGGRVNRNAAQTFAWTFQKSGDYYCAGDFTQQSATFYWKLSTASSYTAVAASGSTQSVTIAAGTFPSGTIQWYVSATDSSGTTTSTPVYSFNTADATTYAYPSSPVSAIADGSKAITFRWTISNDYGSAATRTQIQYHAEGADWQTLTTVTGSGTSYTAPANTFSPGTVYWRVRAYNQDSVAGPYSSAVSFVNVAAPAAPSVRVTAVPFTIITWSASGQQAYRIAVDGETIGTFFGTDKRYQLETYLPDGEHTASVAVQNEFGLWSEEGSTSFSIMAKANVRKPTLSVAFGVDAVLTWSIPSSSSRSRFYIYRDGVLIGTTDAMTWTDRFSLGTHSYYVLRRLLADYPGEYSQSLTVTGTIALPENATMISAVDGGPWISLRLSEFSAGEQSFSWSRTHSLRHITAARLPLLELSPFEDGSGSYACAFQNENDADAFEQLRGKIVVVKSRRSNVVVGLLASLEKRVGDFFTSYSFTIQRIHWEDGAYDENA